MKVVLVEVDRSGVPVKIKLSIFHAPHRRMHIKVIQQYRQVLYDAFKAAGFKLPIDYYIDLDVLFVEPSTPDLGNAYLALEQALDGNTLSKHNAVLVDDELIVRQRTAKYFPWTEGKK